MARPTTKNDLIEAANNNFIKLWSTIDSMGEKALKIDFDFTDDLKKSEAHWSRDKNLRDILIHLYEWQTLLLKWIKSNRSGTKASFLPEPYTWKSYGDLNVEFCKKHQNTTLIESEELLNCSHKEVLELVSGFSNEELFTKQYFDWTGTTTLGSYCVSTLSSHYDWAIKKLKAHIKKIGKE